MELNMARKTAIDLAETFPGSRQQGREVRNENPPPVFKQFDPRSLKPHQKNSAIYDESEDATELIDLIRMSGWVKPLVITPRGTIISGHQRCKAVLALGWESLMVEVREFADELAELEALLLENASRLKTTEQKVREGEAWRAVKS
jgi:ParB family chromosome partitioning protein